MPCAIAVQKTATCFLEGGKTGGRSRSFQMTSLKRRPHYIKEGLCSVVQTPQQFPQSCTVDRSHACKFNPYALVPMVVTNDAVDAHLALGQREQQLYGRAGRDWNWRGNKDSASTHVAHARNV